jgi:hypothetical protein
MGTDQSGTGPAHPYICPRADNPEHTHRLKNPASRRKTPRPGSIVNMNSVPMRPPNRTIKDLSDVSKPEDTDTGTGPGRIYRDMPVRYCHVR